MAIVDFLAVLAVLAAVVWLVSSPLRSPAQAAAREEAQLADLEAAKADAKALAKAKRKVESSKKKLSVKPTPSEP